MVQAWAHRAAGAALILLEAVDDHRLGGVIELAEVPLPLLLQSSEGAQLG